MSSWISHFPVAPETLTVLGMNAAELASNPMAGSAVVQDINVDKHLPFEDASFAAVVCCVSVDYLVHPIEVFDEVARILSAGGVFVCTFSNRCFPTKAIRGWIMTDDRTHTQIVSEYFKRSRGWQTPEVSRRATTGHDPLYAVWARRTA